MVMFQSTQSRPIAADDYCREGEHSVAMTSVCKTFIAQALQFNIYDVRTYVGHNGNLVIRIGASDDLVLKALQKQAEILKMQTMIRRGWLIEGGLLYCIAVNERYTLK